MTPMRMTFVNVERLLYAAHPELHTAKCNELFIALLNLARDPEEAGEAALFISTALIYLRQGQSGSPEANSKLKAELLNRSQSLAAVMLARRGQVKGTYSDGDPRRFTDAEACFLGRASKDGVLVFRPRDDAMVIRLMERGLLKSEADPNPDFKMMLLTAAGYEALAYREAS